ncbi:sensor histidine kinase [Nonomuraea sp. NPDC059007]|uniref:sensor histidine kinase n=1 Tax=Nonomuraea sp. NPDC059007 TaxID=3346692 RepID=UPI0036A75AAE
MDTLLRKPAIQDGGLAVALLIATIVLNDAGTSVRRGAGLPVDGEWPAALTIWWTATAVCVVAVAVRRRWPVTALAAACLATVAHMAVIAGPTPADLAVPITLHAVAQLRRRTLSLALSGATLLVATGWSAYVALDGRLDGWSVGESPGAEAELVVRLPLGKPQAVPAPDEQDRPPIGPTDWGGFPILLPVLVAAWAMGAGARHRRDYLDELTARAHDLERERDQQAALSAAAERGRITRELHDVVAHGLSVIVMQAQGGAAAFARRPQDTIAALDTIVETGRASLADMRHVLAATGPPSTHPVAGLVRLPHLVDKVRASGTPVELHVSGSPKPLPTAVDLAGYRIVQEALTNTMKHAGHGARARVDLTYGERELIVVVSDDGLTARQPGNAGNGLRGMRERVWVLGGSISAGPGPDGFAVHARLPFDGGPA